MYGSRLATTISFAPPRRGRAAASSLALVHAMGDSAGGGPRRAGTTPVGCASVNSGRTGGLLAIGVPGGRADRRTAGARRPARVAQTPDRARGYGRGRLQSAPGGGR